MQHLQPNTTLQGGKYRIEQVLGQGGFGITYLARNTVFDIDVAIKEFFMKDENDRDGSSVTMPNTTKQELFQRQMDKFKKEAKRMFAIKNEHIVGVQDLFEENGTAYYVMDYVDGENLAERLKRTGKPMSEQEVRDILPQILDALKSIHDAGIWHLDLKPANIMLDKSGNVKLIDFGASKQLNAQKGGATTSTAISYTNGYAPREQMEQNYDKFGPWTDIYALGATLYNLLTNKRPPMPSDIDDDETDDKHEALPFPDSTSVDMRQLVLRMLSTNRNKRQQRIEDVVIPLEKQEREVDIDSETTILSSSANVVNEETVIIPKDEKEIAEPSIEENLSLTKTTHLSLLKYTGIALLLFLTIHCLGIFISVFSKDTYNWICLCINNSPRDIILLQIFAIPAITHFFFALYFAFKGVLSRNGIILLNTIIILGLLLHFWHFWYNMMLAENMGYINALDPSDGFGWLLEIFSNPISCVFYVIWLSIIWVYLYKYFWTNMQIADKKQEIFKERWKSLYLSYVTVLILCYLSVVIAFSFGIAPSLSNYTI